MNLGRQPSGDAIFLVQCAGYKCLAVRGTDGEWKSFYDGIDLPDGAKAIAPVPFEQVLPFIPGRQRERWRPLRLPA